VSTAVITMAGFGRRFLDVGYTIPKYCIEAHGQPLFYWSMMSLRSFIEAGYEFVFVVRRADDATDFIRASAASAGIKALRIVELDAPTDGQATTALLAAPLIADRGAPLLIYNIDTFVHPRAIAAKDVRGDGWVPCFPGEGDHWSFAAVDQNGRAHELREKERISPHATVGLYWFSSFDLYRRAYERHFEEHRPQPLPERYIAPLYNELISMEYPVYIHEIPAHAVVPLGTPIEVEAFKSAPPPQL